MKKKTRKQRPSFRELYKASPLIQRNLATACASLAMIVILTVIMVIVTLLEAKGIR